MGRNLEEIKEKIHTINPEITDELLELLYEYVTNRLEINLCALPAFEEETY